MKMEMHLKKDRSAQQVEVIRKELCLANLNYTFLFDRLMRQNYGWYLAVITFELFAAFQVNTSTHRYYAPNLSMLASSANASIPAPGRIPIIPQQEISAQQVFGYWEWVDPSLRFASDAQLRRKVENIEAELLELGKPASSLCLSYGQAPGGWRASSEFLIQGQDV
jgi:hypothetical protein